MVCMSLISDLDHNLAIKMLDFNPPYWADQLLRVCTYLGDSRLMAILIPLLGLYLQQSKGWKACLVFILLSSTACLTCESIKHLVNRQRPEINLMRLDGIKLPTSPSFPSGHTFSAAALYPGFAIIIARLSAFPTLRILFPVFGISIALLVAFTRIYLGVHFLSDVIAGLLGGFTFAFTMGYLVLPKRTTTPVKIDFKQESQSAS